MIPENPLPLRFWTDEEKEALQAELVEKIRAGRAAGSAELPDPLAEVVPVAPPVRHLTLLK